MVERGGRWRRNFRGADAEKGGHTGYRVCVITFGEKEEKAWRRGAR